MNGKNKTFIKGIIILMLSALCLTSAEAGSKPPWYAITAYPLNIYVINLTGQTVNLKYTNKGNCAVCVPTKTRQIPAYKEYKEPNTIYPVGLLISPLVKLKFSDQNNNTLGQISLQCYLKGGATNWYMNSCKGTYICYNSYVVQDLLGKNKADYFIYITKQSVKKHKLDIPLVGYNTTKYKIINNSGTPFTLKTNNEINNYSTSDNKNKWVLGTAANNNTVTISPNTANASHAFRTLSLEFLNSNNQLIDSLTGEMLDTGFECDNQSFLSTSSFKITDDPTLYDTLDITIPASAPAKLI